MKKWFTKLASFPVLLVLMLAMAMPPALAQAANKKLVVGSKEFTEQLILGQIMIALLDHHGFDCVDKTGLGGTLVARNALVNKQIDIYMEYTGTGLLVILKHKKPITNPQKCYEVVKKEDLEKNHMVWLPYMKFNDTYCIMMRKSEADKLNIHTLSQLADYVKAHPDKLKFGVNAEFFARPDGYKAMEKAYDFMFPSDKVVKMTSGLLYTALKDGQLDVSMGFATDGRIKAFDFVVLKDNKDFFPVYNPAPVVREATAKKYPQLKEIFAKLGAKLDTKAMVEMNYQVDIKHKSPKEVAEQWLKSVGLI